MFDLGMTFLSATERRSDAEAIVDGKTRLTYGQWFECIRRVAGGLSEVGLRSGDHFVFVLKNRWQSATLHWACQLIGVVATPMNWRAKAEEINFVLRDADAKVVAFEPSTSAAVYEAVASYRVICLGVNINSDVNFEDLSKSKPADKIGVVKPDDISVMLYTSGTTGQGKGVPRSHRAERSATIAHIVQNEYAQSERILGVMPLYHTMGVRSLLSMALINGCFVCQPRFDAEEALRLIEQEKITALYLVPTLYHDLIEHKNFPRFNLESVRRLGSAGAPFEAGLLQRVNDGFRPRRFVNHYGSSEIYTFTVEPDAPGNPGSAGRAGVNQRIRIVKIGSNDPAETVETGETGQIIADLGSEEAFTGYWKRPEDDKKSLQKGWYFTGDIGRFDIQGKLFLEGRIDDMIICGGENVYPVEIETILLRYPGVLEAAVVGIPDERWGAKVTAFLRIEEAICGKDLDKFCRDSSLADFKRPRTYVFVKNIPKSPVGKILRRLLVAGDYELDGRISTDSDGNTEEMREV